MDKTVEALPVVKEHLPILLFCLSFSLFFLSFSSIETIEQKQLAYHVHDSHPKPHIMSTGNKVKLSSGQEIP